MIGQGDRVHLQSVLQKVRQKLKPLADKNKRAEASPTEDTKKESNVY